jgi:hypothetical protein
MEIYLVTFYSTSKTIYYKLFLTFICQTAPNKNGFSSFTITSSSQLPKSKSFAPSTGASSLSSELSWSVVGLFFTIYDWLYVGFVFIMGGGNGGAISFGL